MSKAPEALYNVTLKHLTRDGSKAGADLPAQQLNHISGKQLRAVIDAIGALAPTVVPPAEPELNIAAPDGKFVVRVQGGALHLVTWSSQFKSGAYPAARIGAIITGEEAANTARREAAVIAGGGGGKGTVVLLAVAILAVNAFTIWFVTRPKRTLLPKYTLMDSGPAERLLSSAAGAYETGTAVGDRRIEIDKTGQVSRYKFGAERALTNKQTFVAAAAEAAGKPALLLQSSRKALVTVNDTLTVELYGDSYRRVSR
jgi:hypothetical protein